jgi:hypothetical protein
MSAPTAPDPVRFDELGFAYVELTVKCNLRCHFCDNEMRNLYRDMPAARFRAIVDQLRPGTRLGLHGLGEPTLHKELIELVRYAKARGLYVYFNTNHTVTSEEQMQGLVALGLDEMRVSMSAGTAGSFARYAGADADSGNKAPFPRKLTERLMSDVHPLFAFCRESYPRREILSAIDRSYPRREVPQPARAGGLRGEDTVA